AHPALSSRAAAEAYIGGVCFKVGPPGLIGAELEWFTVCRTGRTARRGARRPAPDDTHHLLTGPRPTTELLAHALRPHPPPPGPPAPPGHRAASPRPPVTRRQPGPRRTRRADRTLQHRRHRLGRSLCPAPRRRAAAARTPRHPVHPDDRRRRRSGPHPPMSAG